MTVAILIIAVLALLMIRVPIAYALIIPSLAYVFFSSGTNTNIVLQKMVSSLDTFTLVAVPMFVLMGSLANASGITERLFGFAEVVVGRIKYALGYVNVIVSLVFSWMSGSATADTAALGKIEVPAMLRRGYTPKFSLGITGSSSVIGAIMPPSIPAVIYAVTAGVSLGGMLLAGVIPALVITACLFLAVWVFSRLDKTNTVKPPVSRTRSEKCRVVKQAVLPLLTPVILIGGILSGWFTPSEAAAIAVTYMILLGFIYGKLSFKRLSRAFGQSVRTTGSVLILVAASTVFGHVLALERTPQMVGGALSGITENPIVFLLLVAVILLIVGMVLEPTAATLIMVPVLAPVAMQFGIDPLHFGVIVILTLVIGLLTPPVGLVLYILSAATDQPLMPTMKGMLTFLPWMLLALLVIIFLPDLSTFLPSLMN